MERYLASTTVHGFSYLQKGQPNFSRLLWLFTICTGFTLAILIINASFDDWNQNQIITTIESIATPIQEVQFPTVTVCQNTKTHPDNWSYLEKLVNILDFSQK